MLRKPIVLEQLIAAKHLEQKEDREQLAKLKRDLVSRPGQSELIQKQINALRVTLANGDEDVQDLAIELEESKAFEASEVGQLQKAKTAEKLLICDALMDVCMQTAADADQALSAAWAALRKHQAAHAALHESVGGAYSALTEGTEIDVHHDQLFLLHSYSTIRNSGPALAEFLVESLQGYDLGEFIKVQGITLNHSEHLTLARGEGQMLGRAWFRLKEIAQRCGVQVHAADTPALPLLRDQILSSLKAGVR